MATTLQVYKITRTCQGCAKPFTYYRIKNQIGRSQAHCSNECRWLSAHRRTKKRELVDFADVPLDWQQILEDKANKLEKRRNKNG